MVVVSNQCGNLTNITSITLYSAITSATVFHLLIKCVLLLFIIWVIFKWEPNSYSEYPILSTRLLSISYKQRKIIISIICILAILVVWFLKKQKFYSDDLFFMGIILVIWVYVWRQNNTISAFLANLTDQSQDIILPNPGTNALDSQGLKVGPVTHIADKRSGVLPEHYDYLPDDIKSISKPAAFDPLAPLSSSDDLPQFNLMINLMEPNDHPVYKLTNEVLTALDNKCLAHDSTDAAKPMSEFMRKNGSGQSKWAFIEESEQQLSKFNTHAEDNKNQPKSLNDKIALQEMFTSLTKYDTVPLTLHSKPTSLFIWMA